MAGEFDVSDIPVVDEKTKEALVNSPLSPLDIGYRPRAALGGQELGGLGLGITGSIFGGVLGGPPGALAGSILGSGVGGFLGEATEQKIREEPLSAPLMAKAGFEEAAWDAGGNLVLKGLGKTFRLGADLMGLSQKSIPDPNKAAQEFLQKFESSLPASRRTGNGLLEGLEGLVKTPITGDIFRKKEREIQQALEVGSKDILTGLAKSPEFEMALRSGSSSQKASGEILQGFIKEGEQSLSAAVDPLYKKLFEANPRVSLIETATGGIPNVSMFGVKSWASKQLASKEALTSSERTILNEIENLPSKVDFLTLHRMRSRWLAENRDKYSSTGTEKNSLAAKTITKLIDEFDKSLDFAAGKTLPADKLNQYRQITKTYREGIQGLQTEAIQEAMKKNPEEVGAYLFSAGQETPINQLYKSVAAAGTLSGKKSKEVLDALRYGYLQAMVNTPENMLKFANELEQNQAARNTFNVLFGGTAQKDAILAMNKAAQLGLVETQAKQGAQYRAVTEAMRGGAQLGAIGTGVYFALSPEQQQNIRDNLGSAAVSFGGLLLTQRKLAQLLLDPKGAKALKNLATAKNAIKSPTAFTKLVVEPMVNILGGYTAPPGGIEERMINEFDISNIPVEE